MIYKSYAKHKILPKWQKICIYQKKAVILHGFLYYERVFRKRRGDIEDAQDRF